MIIWWSRNLNIPNKKKNNIISFPSAPSKLERQVEAILFAAAEPLDIETIEKRLETNTKIKNILEKIQIKIMVAYRMFTQKFINKSELKLYLRAYRKFKIFGTV